MNLTSCLLDVGPVANTAVSHEADAALHLDAEHIAWLHVAEDLPGRGSLLSVFLRRPYS